MVHTETRAIQKSGVPLHVYIQNGLQLLPCDRPKIENLSVTMITATYSRVGDLELQLDILLPASPAVGTLPGIVHIHSGGMTAGSRSGWDCFDWIRGTYGLSREAVQSY